MRNRVQVISTLLNLSFVLASSNVHSQEVAKSKGSVVPLSLSMSAQGSFSQGYSWRLKARSTGQAHLSIESYPNDDRHLKCPANDN